MDQDGEEKSFAHTSRHASRMNQLSEQQTDNLTHLANVENRDLTHEYHCLNLTLPTASERQEHTKSPMAGERAITTPGTVGLLPSQQNVGDQTEPTQVVEEQERRKSLLIK